MSDTERTNNRLLSILENCARELNEKAELVRSVGQQLIALAATQSVSDGSVEWSVRTANEGQSLEIELALRGQSLNVRLRDVRFGDVIRPVFTDNAQGDDVAF